MVEEATQNGKTKNRAMTTKEMNRLVVVVAIRGIGMKGKLFTF